ncbi:MAG: hypothetical protein R3C10_12880 [Pirellulales bacterium]
MSENPYQAPSAVTEAVGIRGGGTMADVRQIATYQKGVLFCILSQIIILVTRGLVIDAMSRGFEPPEGFAVVSARLVGIVVLASAVFVILLSIKVYHPVVGVLFGLLAIVPCFGLLVLLLINQRATTTLRQNGIQVGLLGAKIPRG